MWDIVQSWGNIATSLQTMTEIQNKITIFLPHCLFFEKYSYSTANPDGKSEKNTNIFTKFHAHCLILRKYCYTTCKIGRKTE